MLSNNQELHTWLKMVVKLKKINKWINKTTRASKKKLIHFESVTRVPDLSNSLEDTPLLPLFFSRLYLSVYLNPFFPKIVWFDKLHDFHGKVAVETGKIHFFQQLS